MGYKFQFITLAGFHQNYAIFDLAKKYKQYGMTAYSRLQQREFDIEKEIQLQNIVGSFDAISKLFHLEKFNDCNEIFHQDQF